MNLQAWVATILGAVAMMAVLIAMVALAVPNKQAIERTMKKYE